MKIKIIDLLNIRARNEKLPSKIKYRDITYNLMADKTYRSNNNDEFIDFWGEDLDYILNDEVEIIEEDKTNKIEKIDVTIKYLSNNLNDCVLEDISNIQIKLNEVIDAVNKLSKDN